MQQLLPDDIIATMHGLRRWLHQYPELSRQEYATTARVQSVLRAAGIPATPVADTPACIAVVQGATPGRVIALRADMDALPIQEQTQLQFASRHDGVMHACGHDAHTAMVVAAALALQRRRNSLAGEVRCIFQHAEECEPTGAREVIAAGVLDGVSAIVGLHVEPELPVGMMGGLQAGPRNAASDQFTLTVHGSEAHGARPEQGIDAIVVAAHIVQALQSIPSRLTAAQEPVVLTIGSIQGGTAPNILAGRVTMYGIIRTMNDATRGRVIAMLSRIAEGTAALYAARAEVVVIHGEPAICNDAAVTEVVRDAVRCVLGESAVTPQPPASMGADDFAYYLEHVPGMMFRLGVAEPDRAAYPLHHPRFAIAENALPLGAAVLAAAAVKLTQGGQG